MKTQVGTITVYVPLKLATRGGRKLIVSQTCSRDDALRRPAPRAASLARAFRWKAMLEAEEHISVAALARAEKQKLSHVYSLLKLTLLAPRIIDGILSGKVGLRTSEMPMLLSMSWADQCCSIRKLASYEEQNS